MEQLNDGKPRKIKVISSRSFKIEDEDLSKYPDYESGGFFEGVKIPIKKSYKSFKEILENNYDKEKFKSIISDKFGQKELLYISFLSIFDYYDKNSSLPDLNNNTQANEIMEKAKNIYDEFSKLSKNGKNDLFKGVKWDEEIPYNISLWAKSEIVPMCSFLEGIISQEMI